MLSVCFVILNVFFSATHIGGVRILRYLSVKTTSGAALARPGPTAICHWWPDPPVYVGVSSPFGLFRTFLKNVRKKLSGELIPT